MIGELCLKWINIWNEPSNISAILIKFVITCKIRKKYEYEHSLG